MDWIYRLAMVTVGTVGASCLWAVVFNMRRTTASELGTLYADTWDSRLWFTVIGVCGIMTVVRAFQGMK